MHRSRLITIVLVLALGSLAGACGGRYLQSPIVDREARIQRTSDSEAIMEVMERYRTAIDELDMTLLSDVISTDYYENGGTTHTTEDDYGHDGVLQMFATLAEHVEDARVELQVRDIRVTGGRADVVFEYAYTMLYRVGESSRWQTQRDVNRIQLQRELQDDGSAVWRIISGL